MLDTEHDLLLLVIGNEERSHKK
uniref:Uncharacterized protein n=1 Tax=Anopheles minimus TaxID=112268 RepID=A0A182WP87_9DIPT